MAYAFNIDQGQAVDIEFQLVDKAGTNLALTSLGTLICTNYYYNPELKTSDRYHLATINNRYNQSIKNENNGVVSATGYVTFSARTADFAKLNNDTEEEVHVFLFTWQWSGRQNALQVQAYVRKVEYMPT